MVRPLTQKSDVSIYLTHFQELSQIEEQGPIYHKNTKELFS